MIFRHFILIATLFLTMSCSNVSPDEHRAETVINSPKAELHDNENTNKAQDHSHHSADPHMRMTKLREPNGDDRRRAQEIADRARPAIEKYRNYKSALGDGFEILLPEIPQKMYHFNKLENYMEAESRFNPERPTSLLYEKTTDGYRLIGVMYTAPAGMDEEQLNERVPLSVAQWHEHINICLPKGSNIFKGLIGQGEKFGLTGSIANKTECDQAGGQFLPRLLGWMVHLYPFEDEVEKMWSVERQMNPAAINQ